MSTVCDSCKERLNVADGCAGLSIYDPAPDFRAMVISRPRRPPQIDLCAGCLLKLIEVLKLPPDTFTPRLPPPAEPALVGALTAEDLLQLGLNKEDP